MSRRRKLCHSWALRVEDAHAVPNATICLALLRCVRRLPGSYPSHDYDELGRLLAPTMEPHRSVLATTLKDIRASARNPEGWHENDLDNPDLLHDSSVLEVIGEQLARGDRRFQCFVDAVEERLERFVAVHWHPYHQNVRFVSDLLGLSGPDEAFLRLSAAFCHGSIARDKFSFVSTASEIQKVLPALCDAPGRRIPRPYDGEQPLSKAGVLSAPSSDRPSPDLDDLLALTGAGERLLTDRFESASDMAQAVLDRLAPRTGNAMTWPHLASEESLLKAAISESLRSGCRGFNVLIHGAPGTGKTEFVRHLLEQIDAEGYAVRCSNAHGNEASREERLESLRLGQAVCRRAPKAVLVLDEAEDIFVGNYNHPMARLFAGHEHSKAWMNALLEGNDRPVIWISNAVAHLDPAHLRRFSFCLEFPQTPRSLRQSVAQQAFADVGCSAETVRSIAQCELLSPADLTAAARFASLAGRSGTNPDTAALTYLTQHMRASGHRSAVLASRPRPGFDPRFVNLSGSASAEQVLAALASGAQATVLLSGAPGTGKTHFAHAIAERLGRHLIVRTASDLHSKWYGESEGNVARMFRDCDPRAEVLFLDEADVLLGARSEASHRVDRAVTAEFLRWLEAFEGTFVCATNHPEVYDAAMSRRFMFRLEFRPLTEQQRFDLFKQTFGSEPADAESKTLSTLDRLTPGDFANAGRRVRTLGLVRAQWVAELVAEQSAKKPEPRQIGFLPQVTRSSDGCGGTSRALSCEHDRTGSLR